MYKDLHLFPFTDVRPGSIIAIYGCGIVGYEYYRQIEALNYCSVAFMIDRNYETIKGFPPEVPILPPDGIAGAKYDCVVVAAHSERHEVEIAGQLSRLGVPREKIVCNNRGRLEKGIITRGATSGDVVAAFMEESLFDPQVLREAVYSYWCKHNSLVAFDGTDGLRWVSPAYDKIVTRIVYETGSFLRDEFEAFFNLVERRFGSGFGGDFCDVGANIGTSSVMAARKKNVKRIFSFEPSRENYACLKANSALNHRGEKITPINMAVSNSDGKAILGLSPINSGDHRILTKGVGYNTDSSNREASGLRTTEQVGVCSLDSYFSGMDHDIGYLWIDTQGYEYYVLAGAIGLLSRRNVAVQIEFWPFGCRETGSLEALCDLIADNFSGYIDMGEFEGRDREVMHSVGEIHNLVANLDRRYDAVNNPESHPYTDLFLLPR